MKIRFLQYKGYYGSYNLSVEDRVFYGKVVYIRDLVTYEADNVESLIESFHSAVDDYLSACEKSGRAPDKPFKGSFNVRIGEELHERLVTSLSQGQSLNSFVTEAIKKSLDESA